MTLCNKHQTNNRIQFMDIAKGIGIFLVVYGHTTGCLLKPYIFLFHMPLFFLVSGYFYRKSGDGMAYAFNKVKSLIVPYIYYIVVLNAIFFLLYYCINKPFQFYPSILIRPYGVATILWFFLALFWVSVLYRVIDFWNKSFLIVATVLLYVMGVLLSIYNIRLPLYLDSACTAIVFYGLGNWYGKVPRIKYFVYVMGILACIYCFLRGDFPIIDMKENQYGNFFYVFISSSVSILTVELSRLIGKQRFLGGILSYLGRNSLYIFTTHLLAFEFLYLVFPQNSVAYSILIAVFAIPLSLLLNYILKVEETFSFIDKKLVRE